MAIKGNKGSHGTNGSSAGIGGAGEDKSFSQNGAIGLDSISYDYSGGDGGDGGNSTTGNGGAGGPGGNGKIDVNGNIFNNPATTTLTVSMTARGGDGGLGGTAPVGFNAGPLGNGGNATVNINGNIIQPNKTMGAITLEAIAIGGKGAKDGNASATLNGNVVQGQASTVNLTALAMSNDSNDSTLHDGDANFGTKTATLNGNVVQGGITNVTLRADAKYSNSSAVLSGNIVQDSATSGSVTLEATGQHIDIENNKITVGKNQELDLTINQLDPAYDTLIKGNEFTGAGAGMGNTFVFTDNGFTGTSTPSLSPTPDTIVIDLSNNSFMFNGKNNKLKNFDNVTVAGNNDPTIIGNNNANILTGGGADDIISGLGGNDKLNGSGGNDLLTGGAGNDTIDGGDGAFDTAVYSGNYLDYTVTPTVTPDLAITVTDTMPARDGIDTLKNVEFLKFSDGLYDVANNHFIPNTAVNHAPAGTDKTVTTNEDTAYTFLASDFGFSDAGDAPPNNFLAVKITTIPAGGVLKDNGVTVNAGDTVLVSHIAANQLVFTPNADFHGAPTFTFQVKDDGGVVGGGVDTDQTPNIMTITVNSVNDAPAGTSNTVITNEDTAYTFAASDFGFSDIHDSDNFLAVKITTIPANGVLKDNGVTVNAGDTVLVSHIAANQLVFTPNADFHGAPSFTFQVKDDGGTSFGGQDTDQSPNTMTITVNSVNDAPAGTDNSFSMTTNTTHTFTAAEFGFSDIHDGDNFLAVTFTTVPGGGTLKDGATTINAGDTVLVSHITANQLVYSPGAGSGAGFGTFTFQVKDDGGTGFGGQDTDQSPNTMTINVSSTLNHAPAGADNTVATNEDTAYTFAASDFGFSDAGDVPPNAFQAVKITTIPANGVLKDNGVTVNAGDTVLVSHITANQLVFTPNADFHGAPTFTFQVKDDGGVAGGGVDTDQSPNVMTITVNSVNDAPAGTDATVTTNEDAAYTFLASDFGFSDVHDGDNFLAVKITTIPSNGVLKDNGVTVNAGDTVLVSHIAANQLVFTPNADFHGAPTFTFQVKDDGGVTNGGQDTDQTPNVMTITVNSVNDAPAGTDHTVITNEDTAYTFTGSDFGFSDIHDGDNFLAVKITTSPSNGVLKDNGVTVNAGDTVLVSHITANQLVFTPNADFHGAPSFTFQVKDDGGTNFGGQDTDQSPNVMTITVNSVNDAPAGTDNTVTTDEDMPYTFAASDFGFSDIHDGDNFLGVKIATIPAGGVLKNGAVTVNAGDTVLVSDINLGNLVFTPNADFHGAPSFTFQVQDDGGIANGGQNTDQSPNIMTITVNSVNDAPSGANNSVNLLEDGAHTFSLGEFGFTDSQDSPADPFQGVVITTTPLNGTLTDNGNLVSAGDTALASHIAANQLVFTPDANVNGSTSFAFQVQDGGGVANGGQDTDPTANLMTLNITSVNDAPSGTDNAFSMSSNTSHVFTVAEFGLTDPNDTPANALFAVEITTLPAGGTLTNNGNAVNAGDFVSAADIIAGNLVFTPAANAFGPGYGSFTFQVQDDGGTANGGVDIDPTANTMTVDVVPSLIVGNQPGDYLTIQDAVDAANPGATILIRAGIYTENVNVNKAGLTLQALSGPGTVTLEGNFSNLNGFGNADGAPTGIATWLQAAPPYTDGNDNGFTVSADNVTLSNITVNDFYAAVTVSGASVSGLTLNGMTLQSSMFGFEKLATTGLNNTTIANSTFTDGYTGAIFYNNIADGSGLDATNTSITGSSFSDIDAKGIYMETAQGNTLLDGITMNNVGQYGAVPSWGANGQHGNGIDINLKYHDYGNSTLTISNFHLTDTGLSNGQGIPVGPTNQAGAIVIEGRDDPTGYNAVPADVSGMTVTVENGIIDGATSIGVRSGEFKANPADNVTGPVVTVTNVAISGAAVSTVDNHTDSLLIVNGTSGNDTYISAMMPGSTGPMNVFGLGGDDMLGGGLGDDIINGGQGNDTLIATPGTDTLNGGANNDTADFSLATNGVNVSLGVTGYQSQGDFGLVKVLNVENLIGSAYADVLTGEAGNNTLQGGGGNDRLVATTGKDTLDGGAGNDTADFSGFADPLSVNLNATGFQTFDGVNQVKLVGIENLIGGSGDDILKGNAGDNILIGGGGSDVLTGNGGTTDIFFGGAGDDIITGSNLTTTDVAYYTGLEKLGNLANYTITGTLGGNGVTVVGPDGSDTLNRVNRVKFLSPSHVSDVDNDGSGDLIFQDSAIGEINVVTNPSGTLSSLSGSPASNWRAVGTGQFNPDGAGTSARKSGILLQDIGTGDMEVITGISGTTSTTTSLSSAPGSFAGFTALTAADFNGDAGSDILLWNNATKMAEIAFLNVNPNEAVGTVDAITTLTGGPSGGNWAPVASGDFNGDGKSDILWQNGVGGAVEITLMNGASVTNTATVPLNTAPGYTAVATGDFDKDGKSDIVFATGGAGSAAEIWSMNGDSMTGSFTVLAPTTGANGAGIFTLKGAEDVNNDGFSDLLWQNSVNGDVVVQELMAGGTFTTVNLTTPTSNFHLVASSGGG